MRTRRTISTVTYNTDMWLATNMKKWLDCGWIDWAHWIRHNPETDETKSHVHLILQPAKMLDTSELIKETYELDTVNVGKLLCCQPWRYSSSIDDWLLYAVHDEGYLAFKGQKRDIHYTIDDICSTNPDFLREQFRAIDMRKYGLGKRLAEMVKAGNSWETAITSGLIPPAQWRYWKEIFMALGGWSRDGRFEHK